MKHKLKVAAVIPARMGSSRFPGKPLVTILGIPMIEHVRRRVEKMDSVDHVYVATCDEEIKKVVEGYGGKVIMTSPEHPGATDRVEEAARELDVDVVINVQGDEPMVMAEPIARLVEPFAKNDEVYCTNLVFPVKDRKDLSDMNVVKAALSLSHRLLFLSRTQIPAREYQADFGYYKQAGIIAFRKDFLHRYAKMPRTPLETKESIDVLRILEHDCWVQGVVSFDESKGVDVPEQIAEVERAILGDPKQKVIYESIRDGQRGGNA